MCSGSSYEILTYVLRQAVTDKQIQFPADLIRLRILWLLRFYFYVGNPQSEHPFRIYWLHQNPCLYALSLYLSLSHVCKNTFQAHVNKGNDTITELRTILQRESQNS
jgi:hypothetical protein